MQRTRQRDTPCELAVRREAHSLGLRYRVDWQIPGLQRRADLAFTRAKVAVFIDGCFWHLCPLHHTTPKVNAKWWIAKLEGNRRRDRNTDEQLGRAGWTVLRFWEHEDPADVAAKISEAVTAQGK